MSETIYHLIHANIAIARASLDDPIMADFVNMADYIDGLAIAAPGFVAQPTPPDEGADKLDTPLDPRHPARHSIWTSVADPMQDRLYRQKKLRLDTSRLYIRNAMSQQLEAANISEQTRKWQEELKKLQQVENLPLIHSL